MTLSGSRALAIFVGSGKTDSSCPSYSCATLSCTALMSSRKWLPTVELAKSALGCCRDCSPLWIRRIHLLSWFTHCSRSSRYRADLELPPLHIEACSSIVCPASGMSSTWDFGFPAASSAVSYAAAPWTGST